MEVKDSEAAAPRKFHKRRRRACRRQTRAVEVGRQVDFFSWSAGDPGGDERGRLAGEHLGAVECVWLRTQEGCAGRVEYVHAHVIGIGPDTQVWVVEKVGPKVKGVAVPTAGGIAGRGDCDAFVSGDAGAGELADEPAIGKLVVERYWVAIAGGFARTTKATPNCSNTDRTQHRGAGRLVKDLEAFVDYLHVLRRPHLAIGIGRRAVARNTREGDAVKVENGDRHVGQCKALQYVECVLDYRIGAVVMLMWDLWIFVSFMLAFRKYRLRLHIAERYRGVILI